MRVRKSRECKNIQYRAYLLSERAYVTIQFRVPDKIARKLQNKARLAIDQHEPDQPDQGCLDPIRYKKT